MVSTRISNGTNQCTVPECSPTSKLRLHTFAKHVKNFLVAYIAPVQALGLLGVHRMC